MFKAIFLFLIALGAALYFPQSRSVVVDLASPVLTPVLRWSTTGEMERIVGDLETEDQTGRALPRQGAPFEEWLARNYQGLESRRDPWGNVYGIRFWTDSFAVTSPGPDGEADTGDDLQVTGQLTNRRRRR